MKWSRFWHRAFWDDERARELQAYLDEEIADNLARGMPPEEASRAAYRRLGNVTLLREEIYQMNSIGWLETVLQDLRYGARLLRRYPTFTAVAVLTLALGTGANTAIFQLVDAVRLRTLPVPNPEELVEIRIGEAPNGRTGSFMSRRPLLTYPQWTLLRDDAQPFASIAAWSTVGLDLASGGEVRPVEGLWVSGGFFDTLAIRPALGRLLSPNDDRPGCGAGAAVISDGFWHRNYGGEASVVGRTILLDGHRFQIVGVTPRSFFGVEVGRTFDVAIPLCTEALIRGEQSALNRRDSWFLASVARLRPGWSVEPASVHLAAVSASWFRTTLPADFGPQDARDYVAFRFKAFSASTGVSSLRRAYERPLWILLGATGIVLLVVCANLANLMLARATSREREIAVRLAIGASRRRIVRQMVSESVLLAALGGILGLALGRWLSGTLVALLTTDSNPIFVDLAFDSRVFAFTTAVAVLACLIFGVVPAARATAVAPASTFNVSSRGTTDSGGRLNLRRALVVAQVAMSLMLIVGALLFVRTFQNLASVETGFRQDGLLIASLDLGRAQVPVENRRQLYNTLVERIQALPGVSTAAEAFIAPVSGSGWNNSIAVDGAQQPGTVNLNSVGPGYFRAMGTPLLAGRDITWRDRPESPRVAVVNESFARKYFGGRPLGRRFQIGTRIGQVSPHYEIVGIVKDAKYGELREEFTPQAYVAAPQDAEPGPSVLVVVRVDVPARSVSPAIVEQVTRVNPSIALQFQTMEQVVRESLVSERLMATLSGFFGVLALVIATVGLYGLMSYMVARRRVEIGIRMALGADRARTMVLIGREAVVLLGIGIAIGLGLALWTGRSAGALLFNLQPWDPMSLGAAAAGLGVVALLASGLPAWRASRLDPTIALREE